MPYTKLIAFSMLALTVPTYSQVVHEQSKLLAPDGTSNDGYGWATSMSADFFVVSAIGDNSNGTNAGAVYVHRVNDGTLQHKLTPADGMPEARFGWSLDSSGSDAIVGAIFDDSGGSYSGTAYLYDLDTGLETGTLNPTDAAGNRWFGWSVSIDGNNAAVSSRYGAGQDSGIVYLFYTPLELQMHRLTSPNSHPDDYFGYSVHVHEGLAVVGAPFDPINGTGSGSAHLYNTATGALITTLVPNDGDSHDAFGWAVAIGNGIVAIAAPGDEVNGPGSGSVYIYDLATLQQIHKLYPSQGSPGDDFGYALDVDESHVAVGAIGHDIRGNSSGTAFVFDAVTGSFMAQLVASDGTEVDTLGGSVCILGATAIAGAVGDDDNGFNSGSVYVFSWQSSCSADTNLDGQLSPADFSAWVAAFNAMSVACDQNSDSMCSPADFSAWVANYNAGCN